MHKENVIGYKELTGADLGRNPTSHQTHIGLFDDVLTFLPNSIEIPDALVIYDNSYEELPVFFDRIQNPNGSFRSPKIRTGNLEKSVVSFIKNTATSLPSNLKWYLFWFGLKSERPVFFVFNDGSSVFNDIKNLGLALPNGIKNRITSHSPIFKKLLNYLVKIVNSSAESLVEELEVLVQIDPTSVAKKYRAYDFDLAMRSISEIGKAGELMVYYYFEDLKKHGLIHDFVWENQEKEKGLPYDFYYVENDGRTVYLDVKTTNHKFNQRMIFSGLESDFVSDDTINYRIYRVYGNGSGNHMLRICSNAKILFKKISAATTSYKNGLVDLASVEGIKFAVSPTQKDLEFGQSINLLQHIITG